MDFLQSVPWPDHVVMNVNFPPVDNHTHHTPHHVPSKTHHIVKGVEILMEDGDEYHIKSCLRSKYFESEDHHDLGHLAKGGVTITPVNTNWTCHETLKLWMK